MKDKGTMVFKTNGGERKMHYAIIDDKIYTSTGLDTNKVEQIANDNICYVNDIKCSAKLLKEESALELYRAQMSFFNRIINVYIGSKQPVVIELTRI